MSARPNSQLSVENRLLSNLPAEEYAGFLSSLERVPLNRGKILYEYGDPAHYAYFVCNGMVSLLSATEYGETIEVGMVGNEGLVGIPLLLNINKMPYRVMVQIRGEALKTSADNFRQEFKRGGKLQQTVFCYMHALLTQVAQSAVCNRFHSSEQRLCRWLLIAHDRLDSNDLELTQELISHMLGTTRNGVSAAAGALQKSGLIAYTRGQITILNLEGLKAASCECYELVAEEYREFLTC